MNDKFIPYGEEWEKELQKRPKKFLIEFIRNLLLEKKEITNALIDAQNGESK